MLAKAEVVIAGVVGQAHLVAHAVVVRAAELGDKRHLVVPDGPGGLLKVLRVMQARLTHQPLLVPGLGVLGGLGGEVAVHEVGHAGAHVAQDAQVRMLDVLPVVPPHLAGADLGDAVHGHIQAQVLHLPPHEVKQVLRAPQVLAVPACEGEAVELARRDGDELRTVGVHDALAGTQLKLPAVADVVQDLGLRLEAHLSRLRRDRRGLLEHHPPVRIHEPRDEGERLRLRKDRLHLAVEAERLSAAEDARIRLVRRPQGLRIGDGARLDGRAANGRPGRSLEGGDRPRHGGAVGVAEDDVAEGLPRAQGVGQRDGQRPAFGRRPRAAHLVGEAVTEHRLGPRAVRQVPHHTPAERRPLCVEREVLDAQTGVLARGPHRGAAQERIPVLPVVPRDAGHLVGKIVVAPVADGRRQGAVAPVAGNMGEGVVGEGEHAALAEAPRHHQRLLLPPADGGEDLPRRRLNERHPARARQQLPRQAAGQVMPRERLPSAPPVQGARLAVGDAADALKLVVGPQALRLDVDQARARAHLLRDGLTKLRGEVVVPLEGGQDDDVVVLFQLFGEALLGGVEGENRAVTLPQPLLVEGGPELDVLKLHLQPLP